MSNYSSSKLMVILIWFKHQSHLNYAVHETGRAKILQSSQADGGVGAYEAPFSEAFQRHHLVVVGQPLCIWNTDS